MICPNCAAEGQESNVWFDSSSSTPLWCPPWWDKDGRYHIHDWNTHWTQYRCSRGHVWGGNALRPCPTCGENWKRPDAS